MIFFWILLIAYLVGAVCFLFITFYWAYSGKGVDFIDFIIIPLIWPIVVIYTIFKK